MPLARVALTPHVQGVEERAGRQPEAEPFEPVREQPGEAEHLLRGWQGLGLEQDADSVTLSLQRNSEEAGPDGETCQLRARFVAGTDGANSFVRVFAEGVAVKRISTPPPERGCVEDQPQHAAIHSAPRKLETCCGWSRAPASSPSAGSIGAPGSCDRYA